MKTVFIVTALWLQIFLTYKSKYYFSYYHLSLFLSPEKEYYKVYLREVEQEKRFTSP